MRDDNFRVCAEIKLLQSPWLLSSKTETGREYVIYFLKLACPTETILHSRLAHFSDSVQRNGPALDVKHH